MFDLLYKIDEEEIINCILNMIEEDWENLARVGKYLKKEYQALMQDIIDIKI